MEFGREFITLFDRVQIRYYGIIIVLAMLVAATMAARLAKRDRRDPDHVWGALTWAIIPAIIGARLWFVLFPTAALVAQGQDTAWYFQNFFNPENGAIAKLRSQPGQKKGVLALGAGCARSLINSTRPSGCALTTFNLPSPSALIKYRLGVPGNTMVSLG